MRARSGKPAGYPAVASTSDAGRRLRTAPWPSLRHIMIVDKCKLCEFYVVVENPADHHRLMQSHERSEHGRIDPGRRNHRSDA